MQQFIDYYKVLGVHKDASLKDIKNNYIKLIRQYHPDVCKDKDADKKAVLINQAYALLSDEEERKIFDLKYNEVIKNKVKHYDNMYSSHSTSYYNSGMREKLKIQISRCLDLYNECMAKKEILINEFVNYSISYTECNFKFIEWLTISNKCKNSLENICRICDYYQLESSELERKLSLLTKSIFEVKSAYDFAKDELNVMFDKSKQTSKNYR